MSNENEPAEDGVPDTVGRTEFDTLAAEVAKRNSSVGAQAILIGVMFALFLGLLAYTMNLENKINDLTKHRDDVTSSWEPLQNLLDVGHHCYDSGPEAVAAQTRIFTAIDLEYLRDGVETRIDHRLNPGVGGSIGSVYMPDLPDVSKTRRDPDGKTCFTVTWPRNTKPRWAGGN